MPYLTILLLIPLVGVLFIVLLNENQKELVRKVAIFHAGLVFIFSWALMGLFDPSSASIQLLEQHQWNVRLGTSYTVGIDGFSYPMVLLATLLNLIAILASSNVKEKVKGYYLLMLILESAMLGVFIAQDWTLFYLFWEMTLIPLFFLIDRWGGKRRHSASINFVLYTMGGSVFMLISLFVLFDTLPGKTFNISEMISGARALDENTQLLIFLGLLIGFGVKMSLFPIHGWLPLAHVEAPSPVSILLSGILLKMGSYGLIRATEMLPKAVVLLQPVLLTIGLVSLIYGGLLAWRQSDLKRMIAYSSVSHMGVVLLGLATLNQIGLTGAVMQMVAHGLVAGILFLLIGLLYERTHTRDINAYSSLTQSTPKFAFFTILAFVAAIGLPGTAGFIAELHVLIGGYQQWQWLIVILSIGVLISATYAIRTIGRLFTGPVRPVMKNVADLQPQEMMTASILAVGIIFIGLYPAPLLDLMSASVDQLSAVFVAR
ncbi:MAG: NADH-quinone oxidoreductase subunit M [Methylococcales bacterium]|nr:NADH-quinone oxidoreductase subunit M [Methylococcales bacterium]